MITDARKSKILAALQADQQVLASELASRFDVSEDTIRRDLRSLASEGLIRRVYGGAVPQSPIPTSFNRRVGRTVEAKSAIVRAALELIRPGQTILLDSGTTVAALAASLPRDIQLTIITHSLAAAMALLDRPLINVVMLGGRVFQESADTVGAETVNGYLRCRADLCFLGIASIDAQIGLGVFDHDDAEVKRAMITAADQVIALVSAEKLGTSAPFIVGRVSDLDRLITESAPPRDQVALIEEAGTVVICV